MTSELSKEVLALSIHVVAASAQVTIQTSERMTLLTNCVLESVEHVLLTMNKYLEMQKHTQLEKVIEEIEDEILKDSKTKECYNDHQQSLIISNDKVHIEVINENQYNENIPPNFHSLNTSNIQVLKPISNISNQQNIQNNYSQNKIIEEIQQSSQKNNKIQEEQQTPQQKNEQRQSILYQQLSQIKIDKEKEAQEQKELLSIIESVDPEELIPRLQSIEIYDEQKQSSSKKKVLIYSDKKQIIINDDENHFLNESPHRSDWFANTSVEYKATSYNTNESSNLDHHSYKWKSNSQEDDNFFQEYGIPFQSSVFDFQFPSEFNANSIPFQQNHLMQNDSVNQNTPKKKRLYCNNKKIPHWAENLEIVSKYQNKQQDLKQNEIFGRMKNKILNIAKQLSDNKYQRGTSANWHKTLQDSMNKLQQIQENNLQKIMSQQQQSIKKNKGLFAKTQYFLTSMKKKILNSYDKKCQ